MAEPAATANAPGLSVFVYPVWAVVDIGASVVFRIANRASYCAINFKLTWEIQNGFVENGAGALG